MIILAGMVASCASPKRTGKVNVLSGPRKAEVAETKAIEKKSAAKETITPAVPMLSMNEPLNIRRSEFIDFAKQYLGVPYLYASSDPSKGFDCSGLLFHVFKHFNVKSPRSSYSYENIGESIALEDARPGDLILFTTAGDTAKIGHIGIISETKPRIAFLHASTSKGVIISNFTGYYIKHFVKVIRVLK